LSGGVISEFTMTPADELTLRRILKEELSGLPCTNRGERLTKIEQRLVNGDSFDDKLTKHKEMSVNKARMYIAVAAILVGFPTVSLTALKILKLI